MNRFEYLKIKISVSDLFGKSEDEANYFQISQSSNLQIN